ncbi:hypothetical protein CDA63_04840 [Hymenobacter amundsenii]|uniref:Carboxypeptidase-like regulatory domain-containing protein n=2 Tax=Hymenobacter amundsenii TaxID=2006685 RepID=A0A246FNR3_9BACT|nr:hypothetical protein CDA63_04840 [Hymenobacter amundsenii]
MGAGLLAALMHPLYAQRTLTGIVQDPQGAAIPFAVVELPARKLGVQANDEGLFSFPLPAGLTPADSLTFSALGYERRRVAVPAEAAATLRLAALPVSLSEVVVRPGVAEWVGFKGVPKSRGGYRQTILLREKNTGWQIARRCQPTADGYLTAVRFFVNPSHDCGKTGLRAPFRVRVYAADGPGGSPGTDLLTTSVLAAATNRGWITVDMNRYTISFPQRGVYVAMEWLHTSDEFLCRSISYNPESHQKMEQVNYEQSLASALVPTAEAHTWYHTIDYGWVSFNRRFAEQSQILDAAIQARSQP